MVRVIMMDGNDGMMVVMVVIMLVWWNYSGN